MIEWDCRFNNLALFNSDKDKTKYSQRYIEMMARLQKEYTEEQLLWAKENYYKIV